MMQTQTEQANSRPIDSFLHHKDLVLQSLNIQNKLHILIPKENDLRRILGFIEDNDRMSDILSKNDQMLVVINKEKDLKGTCKLGIATCIDGRISILHKFGKTANTWEIAGSQIEIVEKEGRYHLTSDRLIGALEDNAEEAIRENRDLLEIVTAHTDKTGKCAKIKEFMVENNIVGDPDTVALKEAEKRREAIENSYNDILEIKGKKKLDQVAITAMINTDTMAFILNHGNKELELSTTDLLIAGGLRDYIESKIGPSENVGSFGSMRNNFTEINNFVEYSEKVANITDHLLNEEINRGNSVIKKVQEYINLNFDKLTPSQKKALQFTIARSIANQYVTGLAVSEPLEHPYSKHQEKFLVIAPAGKPFGRHVVNSPSFGSTPKDRKDALKQIHIELSILDKHKKKDSEPDVLFVSTPIREEILELKGGQTYHQAIDANLKYYNHCLGDARIRKKINEGSLIIVPVVTDEEDGRVLRIMDFSIYANSVESQKTA